MSTHSNADFPNLTVVMHPLVQHKLTWLREKNTNTDSFRNLLREVSQMLVYEATRDLPTEPLTIQTPICEMQSPVISGKKLCLASILRAGNGLLDGALSVLPLARVAHIGLYRDPTTLEPVEYYFKAPSDMHERQVIVVDPMLATGNSAVAAIDRIKEQGCVSIKLHPDVPIITASLDSHLDEHGYIVPGLGDAGDRIFGTF
jgi:uracil phosphoribosyltransferase